MTDPEYKTVCDRCGRGTWYEDPQPCRMSRPTYCPTCHQTTGEGPCGGTLRVIDRSDLAPAFAPYYGTGVRVRVKFSYSDEELTGTIGRTTGWRPAYLLMRRSSDRGSIYTLAAADRIVAVKHGRKYVPA
jgi:hypothetical protein